jgi:hypothetical protein
MEVIDPLQSHIVAFQPGALIYFGARPAIGARSFSY